MHSSTSHNPALFSPKTLALIGSNKFLGWIVVLALLHSALYLQSTIETDGVSYVEGIKRA